MEMDTALAALLGVMSQQEDENQCWQAATAAYVAMGVLVDKATTTNTFAALYCARRDYEEGLLQGGSWEGILSDMRGRLEAAL